MSKYVDLEAKVLRIFLDDPEAGHFGFDIMKAAGIDSGKMYVVLARLEARGLVRSDWAAPAEFGQPRRRVYMLTAWGAAYGARMAQ